MCVIVGERFARENDKKLQLNLQAFYPFFSGGRWLGIRLDFIGNLSVCFAAAFVALRVCTIHTCTYVYTYSNGFITDNDIFVTQRGQMDPGYGALAITCIIIIIYSSCYDSIE